MPLLVVGNANWLAHEAQPGPKKIPGLVSLACRNAAAHTLRAQRTLLSSRPRSTGLASAHASAS